MNREEYAIYVEQLNFAYKEPKKILKDINFSVGRGEYVAIIGDSGCGKSTLCHILCGIIPNALNGVISGEVYVGGVSLREADLKDMATVVGFVMQDADRQIVSATVEDELAFGPENLCVPPPEICRRVDEALKLFDLKNLKDRDPNKLSSGQKKLVTIAGVLTLQPEIFLLDEPFSSLDLENEKRVKKAIDTLLDRGKTVVVVEHDHASVASADRWIWLAEGEIRGNGPPEEVKKVR